MNEILFFVYIFNLFFFEQVINECNKNDRVTSNEHLKGRINRSL